MATQCWSMKGGCVLRITDVDECGNFSAAGTECSQVTTAGFVEIEFEPDVEEGEEILVRNACGDVCVFDPGKPSLKTVEVTFTFCVVDPDVFNIAAGYPKALDAAAEPNTVGFDVTDTVKNPAGFALEVWSPIVGQACTGATPASNYLLFPWLTNGIVGDFTIENDALQFTLTAASRIGNLWGTGPVGYDVQLDALEVPGPLVTPVPTNAHYRTLYTEAAPPEVTCGCQAMPSGS